MFTNSENQQIALTQKIADKLVDDYIASVAIDSKFNAQCIMRLHKTCGGAYGDKVRKRLFEVSQLLTQAQASALTEDIKTAMRSKNKLCVYYNTLEDSRRQKYEFVRVF